MCVGPLYQKSNIHPVNTAPHVKTEITVWGKLNELSELLAAVLVVFPKLQTKPNHVSVLQEGEPGAQRAQRAGTARFKGCWASSLPSYWEYKPVRAGNDTRLALSSHRLQRVDVNVMNRVCRIWGCSRKKISQLCQGVSGTANKKKTLGLSYFVSHSSLRLDAD